MNQKVNRVLSLFLTLLLVLGLLPVGAMAASGPIVITTAEELQAITMDGNYLLGGDIVLEGEWVPIGTGDKPFAGTFDGDGHAISELSMTGRLNNQALFAKNTGTIKNLTVDGDVSGGSAVAGIVAVNSGLVENCWNKANVTGSEKVAGIVGAGEQDGVVRGCVNTGAISSTQRIAGILGYATKFTTIRNCYNAGSITATSTKSAAAGGIAGFMSAGTLQNCYNKGIIRATTATAQVSGFVGFSNATSTNCYYLDVSYMGTILSGGTATATSKSADELKELTDTLNNGSPEGSAYVADSKGINGGYPILECQMPKVEKYEVLIAATPATATIVVTNADGVVQNGAAGAYRLSNGAYTYTVSAFGYTDKTGGFTIADANHDTISVELDAALRQTVTLNVMPADAKVTVTHAVGGVQNAEADGTYQLVAGSYTYTVIAKGYAPKTDGRMTVADAAVTESIALVPLASSEAWDGTTKTEVTPIDGTLYIQNGAELAWFGAEVDKGNQLNATVVLLQDIDLGSHNWESIGEYGNGKAFVGRLDGNGCTLNNLGGSDSFGLFYNLGTGGTLEHLTVNGQVSGSSNIGGLVGINAGTVRDCASAVHVAATGQRAGGIVGNNNGGTIIGCTTSGAVATSYNSYANTVNIGGVAGQNSGTIQNSYNTAAITATGRNHNGGVGGIAGENSGRAENCYSTGTVSYTFDPDNNAGNAIEVDKATGAIAGSSSGTVANCLYRTDSSTHGIGAGTASKDGALAQSAAEMKLRSAVITLNSGSAEGPFYLAENAQQNDGYPVLKWQGGKGPDASLDEAAIATDKAALTLPQTVYVDAGTIDLPTFGAQGSAITWSSSNTAVITSSGVITLPASDKVDVLLTATLAKGDRSDTKVFTITVYSAQLSTLNHLEAAKKALGSGRLVPVCGTDTNVIPMVQSRLEDSGFSDVTVALTAAGTTAMGGEDYIAADGSITYFYRDPSNGAGNFATVTGMAFSLSKEGESIQWENVTANIYWDRDKVLTQLDAIANQLTWDAIKNQNTDQNQITLPLSLPLEVDGKGWASIQWEANTDVLAIPEPEIGQKKPLTATVNRPQVDTAFDLTATVRFNLTNSVVGDEPDITVTRSLPVTVKGNGVDNMAQMQENLNTNYTLAKINDFITKAPILPDQVTGDLLLPTPSKTGVPDSSAYQFTASSTNADVLTFNGYRGLVYRPLPGETPVTVGFTVTMTSRANKSLSVSKNFEITVLPLTQAEIEDALKLMTAVQADYANAILGAGNAKDAVVGHMNPYKEAVFDKNGQTLVYSRALENDTNKGVRIDDLPGSGPDGPGYEKWRTFRSSRPDLLLHEMLRLEQQPIYDTSVTITSCLTHEVLGKYAAKYPKNKAFQALYQVEVMAAVTVKGSSTAPNPNPDASFSASFALDSKGYIENISETSVSGLKGGATAFDVLKKVFTDKGYTLEGSGRYIVSVTDRKGKKIGELDKGANSGWMYRVNGVYSDKSLDEYYLTGGEKIQLYYVDDYTHESGNPVGDANSKPTETTKPDSTVTPSATTDKNGEAKAVVSASDVSKAVEAAKKNGSTVIVIAPEIKGDATKVIVDLPKSALAGIGKDSQAALACKLGIANVSIPNRAIVALGKEAGETVHVSAAKKGDNVVIFIAVDDKEQTNMAGGITVALPAVRATAGTVLVLVDAAGQESIVQKSVVDGEQIYALLNGSATLKRKDNSKPFSDIADAYWGKDAVGFATSRELFQGTSATTFSPEDTMTRGMLVTVLHRLEQETATAPSAAFQDVPADAWYANAAAWAAEKGIVTGTGEGFDPEGKITREALAAILYRYAKSIDLDTRTNGASEPYRDAQQVSDWAAEGMDWAIQTGLMTGKGDQQLDPTGNATRAEVCTILLRLVKKIAT